MKTKSQKAWTRAAGAILVVAGLLSHDRSALAYTAVIADGMILASKAAPKRATARPVAVPARTPSRLGAPVVTVSGTAPGQTGYVHYFVITGPDGEPESQVGIELPDGRIAWSFPELGVVISPFVATGMIAANGKSYEVEHLYGIRPFPDEKSMEALRRDLPARVAPWVSEKIAYCDEAKPAHGQCVSCLGFAMRILFPGPTVAFPAVPADFKTAAKDVYTTEDLLLYLAGVPIDATAQARLSRIESLAVPEGLREQLLRIATAPSLAPTTATTKNESVRAGAKPRVNRSVVQLPKRVLPRRRS